MSERRNYSYEVVTSNGAGVHAKGFKRPAEARAAMERLAARWKWPDLFEIQRVWINPVTRGRRYWMRRRSRWVEWDCHRDATCREPDWHAVGASSRE